MVSSAFIRIATNVLKHAGFEIRRIHPTGAIMDQPSWVNEIIARVRPYTLLSSERIASLCNAVEYIVRHNIPGDIVECGIWKGGSMMAAALTLLKCGETERALHLFDTYEGMTAPTEKDQTRYWSRSGIVSAAELISGNSPSDYGSGPVALDEVRQNLSSVGYPDNKIVFVKGPVEETLPKGAPVEIALFRLDTNWYESTRHELIHLYPRLARGGVMIIDDYGHWEGAKKAVDEYIKEKNLPILLNRTDYTERISIKL